jgi:hypothetical protein
MSDSTVYFIAFGTIIVINLLALQPWKRKSHSRTDALLPGECECSHLRCQHFDGDGACSAYFWLDANGKPKPQEEQAVCGCKIYIKEIDDDDDDHGGGDDVPTPTPTVDDLERLGKL